MSLVRGDIDIIARLREFTPRSAATWSDAHSVAERQAIRLLRLQHIEEPPVPQFIISALPSVTVDRRSDWPTSGMAVEAKSRWRIVLCADEPLERQRFSLAHEFKHVLDAPFIKRLYLRVPKRNRAASAERLCNVFAACLLMPRAWVKRDWCDGLQDIGQLSRRYYVSEEAMTVRLAELGLIDPHNAPAPSNRSFCLTGAR